MWERLWFSTAWPISRSAFSCAAWTYSGSVLRGVASLAAACATALGDFRAVRRVQDPGLRPSCHEFPLAVVRGEGLR